jgi:hypothetical protein
MIALLTEYYMAQQGTADGEDLGHLMREIREYHDWVHTQDPDSAAPPLRRGASGSDAAAAAALGDGQWHSARNLRAMQRRKRQRQANSWCKKLGDLVCC